MKRRKMTAKLERFFKGLDKVYNFSSLKTTIGYRDSKVIHLHEIKRFSTKYNLTIRLGIGCFVVDDNTNKYTYLVVWNKNKLIVESKDQDMMRYI